MTEGSTNKTGDDQASITEEFWDSAKRSNHSNHTRPRMERVDNNDDDLTSIGTAPGDIPEILLEGWMLKQNRNHFWQDRYFVFQSNQTLSYRRKQDDVTPRAVYRITRDTGCEISDVFVEQTRSTQHHHHPENHPQEGKESNTITNSGKESLYCVTISWPNDTATISSKIGYHDSFREDGSYNVGVGGTLSPDWSGWRPSSPGSAHNGPASPCRKKSKLPSSATKLLKCHHSDVGNRNINIHSEESSIDSAGLSLPGTEKRKNKRKLFSRHHKRGQSTTDLQPRTGNMDDDSIPSLPEAPTRERYSTTPDATSRQEVAASDRNNTPDIKLGETRSPHGRVRRAFKSRKNNPGAHLEGVGSYENGDSIGIMDLPPVSLADVDESRELNVDKEIDQLQIEKCQTERIANLTWTLSDEYGVQKKPSSEEQILIEQEKLHHEFWNKQRKKRSETQKRAIAITKIAVATSTAIGIGIVTAGVGLVAGLAFLGVSAAIGGTAGVAEVGIKSVFKKKDHLTIATTNYELAKLWKSTLEACMEQESLRESTWGQLYVAEGREPTRDFIINVKVGDGDDPLISAPTIPHASPQDKQVKGKANLFLRDPCFLAHTRALWRPLEGGWVSFLGPGAQSLRVFKEERIRVDKKSKKIAPLAVGGSSCSPLRANLVLNAHPTEAFMCIMSYARIHSVDEFNGLSPNSGQSASYRLIERIDDHTDILHLVCRKLYLFPLWTEARDFVLLRYWRHEPDGSYVICYESMEHPDCPPHLEFVRGKMHQVYTIAPPKKHDQKRNGNHYNECMLTSVVQVDPMGWIPTSPMFFLSNQSYADAFGIAALLQTLDIRDAIENDRFLDLSLDLHFQPPSSRKRGHSVNQSQDDFDMRYVNRERCDSFTAERFPAIGSHPEPLSSEKWAEPDANSFMVRGPSYKSDRVKINAGASIGQLIAVDVVQVDKPIYSGMSTHPSERIQLALKREKILKKKGIQSDMPPFIFVVNIILPGPPFFHGVFYYAVDDISTINGEDGTPSSKLCKRFLFGDSDEFRDRTFKLIPRIVEGNFLVRKAVGNTPAIMGTKLKQTYVRNERFMEVILDCGSSAVATGVIRLSLGYAKTLVVDMGFLLEGDSDEYLPERIFGAVRTKYPSFGPHLRKVEDPEPDAETLS